MSSWFELLEKAGDTDQNARSLHGKKSSKYQKEKFSYTKKKKEEKERTNQTREEENKKNEHIKVRTIS